MPLFPYRPDLSFGVAAEDVLTGFAGRITAITRRITGADLVCLEPMPPAASGASRVPGAVQSEPVAHWVEVIRVRVMTQVPAVSLLPGPVPPYAMQDTAVGNAGGPGRPAGPGGVA